MTISKAQQKAVNKYIKDHYDRVNLMLPGGDKQIIKAAADQAGLSMAQYIRRCLVAAGCPLEEQKTPSD